MWRRVPFIKIDIHSWSSGADRTVKFPHVRWDTRIHEHCFKQMLELMRGTQLSVFPHDIVNLVHKRDCWFACKRPSGHISEWQSLLCYRRYARSSIQSWCLNLQLWRNWLEGWKTYCLTYFQFPRSKTPVPHRPPNLAWAWHRHPQYLEHVPS